MLLSPISQLLGLHLLGRIEHEGCNTREKGPGGGLFICMFLCVHMYMYMYIYVVCMCMYIYIYMCICVYASVCKKRWKEAKQTFLRFFEDSSF